MQRVFRRSLAIAVALSGPLVLVAASNGGNKPAPASRNGMSTAAIELRSAGVMQFGPDGTLFLADPMAATVYAIDVAEAFRDTTVTGVRIDDLDVKLAAGLGVSREDIRIVDMAAHPISQTLYFSLTRGRGDNAVPLLVSITKADEVVKVLPLENIRHSKASVADAPAPDKKTPWGQPSRGMSITDLALFDGELYIAGLSNEEFASTLRRMPYPFGRAALSTSVEVYHTSHDRYETASPIESFLPMMLNNRPSLLAGYGCSPIAVFSRDDLAGKGKARGRTVAEIGGGSRPLDMIRYTTSGKEYVLIANSDRTLTRFEAKDFASSPALTTPVAGAYVQAGTPYLSIATFGVMQLDHLNARNAVLMRRGAQDGHLHISSLRTGAN
jgi:hypothetical protein